MTAELHPDELVPTPGGLVPASRLRAGDTAYDQSGAPVELQRVTRLPEGPMRELRLGTRAASETVTVSAGQLVTACTVEQVHRWRRNEGGTQRIRADWPLKSGTWGLGELPMEDHRGRHNLVLPLAPALMSPEAELPWDPYALGFRLSNARSLAGEVRVWSRSRHWAMRTLRPYGAADPVTRGAWSTLEVPGIPMGPIPEAYALASPDQRAALLDGLADGCRLSELQVSSHPGKLVHRLHDEASAELVRWLITSLGHAPSAAQPRPTRDDNPRWGGNPLYDVTWRPTFPVGRCPQLRGRGLGAMSGPWATSWKLASVSPIAEAAAIRLEAGSLILAGRATIPL